MPFYWHVTPAEQSNNFSLALKLAIALLGSQSSRDKQAIEPL